MYYYNVVQKASENGLNSCVFSVSADSYSVAGKKKLYLHSMV
jgi:hypothetical protein